MKAFVVGSVYSHTFVCDSSAHCSYKVVRRTAKSVWLEDEFGDVKRRLVSVHDDSEICHPLGQFSMSPILRATK